MVIEEEADLAKLRIVELVSYVHVRTYLVYSIPLQSLQVIDLYGVYIFLLPKYVSHV